MSGAHRLRRLSSQASGTAREDASFLVRRADTEWALQHHHLLSRVGSRHAARPCCSAADTQNASPGCRSAQRLLSRPAAPKRVGPGSLTNSYAEPAAGAGVGSCWRSSVDAHQFDAHQYFRRYFLITKERLYRTSNILQRRT